MSPGHELVNALSNIHLADRRAFSAVKSRREFLSLVAAGCGLASCSACRGEQTGTAAATSGRNASSAPDPAAKRQTRSAFIFGAKAELIVLHEDADEAARALELAVAELREVEEVLSLYRPDSALCRLNREGVLTRPHPFLVEVLSKARQLSELTDGAFDVTVQPLWELYAAAKREGRVPEKAEIEVARRKVDWRKLTTTRDRVCLGGRGMAVTLNALAQGFAADRVLSILRAHSIRHALVNTGEIGAMGCKEGGEAWSLGIQHPRRPDAYVALVRLADCCVATSGDYATRFSEDSRRHHIFNPATGESPRELASATVVAPSGLDADGLATALLVLGREKGLKLLQSFPAAEAFLVNKDGQTNRTPRFPIAA